MAYLERYEGMTEAPLGLVDLTCSRIAPVSPGFARTITKRTATRSPEQLQVAAPFEGDRLKSIPAKLPQWFCGSARK